MELSAEVLLSWKSAAVAAWFGLLFLGERLAPAAPWPARTAARTAALAPGEPAGGPWRLARNLGLLLLTASLSPLIVVPLSLWASGLAPDWRPAAWSGGWGLLLDVVLLDFLIYWWHLANHRVPFLWRFHEVHHLDRFLDTTTAVRFHFGEVLLSALARAGVIVLLGFPILSILVFEGLVLVSALFHHSNLRLPAGLERALSLVVITPSIHWVHHHKVRADTDSNYGTIFSFWDRLFASRSPTRRSPDMAIGVEGREEEALLGLLIRPFRPAAR